MNPIQDEFEIWYVSTDLTEKQREAILDYENGHYTCMQTRLAYDAFAAGYRAGKK